jgi:hypothetical protein
MPRIRQRTTNRGTDSEAIKRAAEICINENKSERSVANQFEICHVSLNRYIKKLKAHRDSGGPLPQGCPNPGPRATKWPVNAFGFARQHLYSIVYDILNYY